MLVTSPEHHLGRCGTVPRQSGTGTCRFGPSLGESGAGPRRPMRACREGGKERGEERAQRAGRNDRGLGLRGGGASLIDMCACALSFCLHDAVSMARVSLSPVSVAALATDTRTSITTVAAASITASARSLLWRLAGSGRRCSGRGRLATLNARQTCLVPAGHAHRRSHIVKALPCCARYDDDDDDDIVIIKRQVFLETLRNLTR